MQKSKYLERKHNFRLIYLLNINGADLCKKLVLYQRYPLNDDTQKILQSSAISDNASFSIILISSIEIFFCCNRFEKIIASPK